jgi:hypothetical protein
MPRAAFPRWETRFERYVIHPQDDTLPLSLASCSGPVSRKRRAAAVLMPLTCCGSQQAKLTPDEETPRGPRRESANMPHMSGFELLSVVRRRFPEILTVANERRIPKQRRATP